MRANLRYLFNPESVAIIGASAHKGKIGYELLNNIITFGYQGKIYPVNVRASEIDSILGLEPFESLGDIPGPVDLALITIPAQYVADAMRECARKKVKACVVITSGFSETENIKGEQELVEIADSGSMILLGPNVFGVVYTPVNLNASFGPTHLLPGKIAFITQSGALGISLMDWTIAERIGLSSVVSVGNKADIDDDDLLEYFAQDTNTKAIAIYMEGIKEGRRFMDLAEKIVLQKPLIVIKSGRSQRGAKAAASHTGSLAGVDTVFTSAFKQVGILRAKTSREAFDWARIFHLEMPEGDNVVIITNGGGAGVMATDEAEENNLHLLDDYSYLEDVFKECVPPFGSTRNPIDLTGQTGEEGYKVALRAAMKEGRIHSVVVIYCEAPLTDPSRVAAFIIEEVEAQESRKPVVVAFIGGSRSQEAINMLNEHGIPTYPEPERAMDALGAFYRWVHFIEAEKKEAPPEKLSLPLKEIEPIISTARKEQRLQLLESEAKQILRLAGFDVPAFWMGSTKEECVRAAQRIGFPVVMKIVSEDIIHKTEVGGVRVGISSVDEVREAYTDIMTRARKKYPDANVRGIIVCDMVEKGVETILGMSSDPQFGPVVMFGLGGIYVEVLKDVSFRVAPLSRRDAQEMLQEIRATPLLYGVRGGEKKDIASLEEAIYRLGLLAAGIPEIAEMDINPLMVLDKQKGCKVVDARMTLQPRED
ncbi:MAG: acetate--CoA ligase family protein [Theionarchaea archaeon]|nr:acetate--CoA ligase family protein [Theionarchaea archaeon]MBU7038519.1 acetate--CoA ligase family protein [Theionarchaea archaeon]